MKTKKQGVTIGREWWDSLRNLTTDEKTTKEFAYALLRYVFDGVKYDGDTPLVKSIMAIVQKEMWRSVCGYQNALKGGKSIIDTNKNIQYPVVPEEVFDEALDDASLPTEVIEEFDEAQNDSEPSVVEEEEPPTVNTTEEEPRPTDDVPLAVREGCVSMEEYEFIKKNEESGTDMTHLPKTKFLRHVRLVEKVREYYNQMVDENSSKLPKCESLSRFDIDNLKGLLMIYGKDIIKEAIVKFTRSKEINDMVDTTWCSGLVWMSSPKHFIGLLNGDYGVEPTELNFDD